MSSPAGALDVTGPSAPPPLHSFVLGKAELFSPARLGFLTQLTRIWFKQGENLPDVRFVELHLSQRFAGELAEAAARDHDAGFSVAILGQLVAASDDPAHPSHPDPRVTPRVDPVLLGFLGPHQLLTGDDAKESAAAALTLHERWKNEDGRQPRITMLDEGRSAYDLEQHLRSHDISNLPMEEVLGWLMREYPDGVSWAFNNLGDPPALLAQMNVPRLHQRRDIPQQLRQILELPPPDFNPTAKNALSVGPASRHGRPDAGMSRGIQHRR